ncbi:type I polyketide synthase [Streptomyces canus]|uniref:type I polyketide synthase n=1 Tax=Streptomyces canus TaxID=58343 RepID=UPI0022595B0B|nr:type I polyketide synthase [Streptomyces canus]MCX4852218.1 SDR family NAD(P)-dependent oxidoreductase [Streptomyces canus]
MENQEKLFGYLKKAAADLQETRQRLRRLEAGEREPLAIVGMACRLPGGADSLEEFWDVLASGVDGVGPFPTDRGWDLEDLHDPDQENGKSITDSGGFLRNASGFDAPFFGISPREALAMDPQQRLTLEVAWETLEHAGINAETLRGSRTGVFIGGFTSNYAINLELSEEGGGAFGGHIMTGNLPAMIAGRVSYTMGLEGPAFVVDTACSSSALAMHLAFQAIWNRECSLALTGGVTVLANPGNFVEFSRQQGLSADGRCRAFSADASGTGWSEGAGLIAVERLSDARRLGHRVLALVRGSAANQDGASNGLTAPSGLAQQRVIRAALESARLSAVDVDVVEAHGTGTKLGDPIEAQALIATYGQERPEGRPLWLGAAKSNTGHTQAAGGVASVIKLVLALKHEVMPRTLHVNEPTPHVDWSVGDVQLLTEPVPWPVGERVRRAGVSSFGGSGTNIHIILEEPPATGPEAALQDAVTAPEDPIVAGAGAWLVSGRSANALMDQADRLREWVTARPELEPADVAWSLATARVPFEHRAVVVGGNSGELVAGLESLAGQVPSGSVVSGTVRSDARPVFVFPGQGSQWLGMGRGLVEVSPVFAARLAECAAALAPHVEWSLMDVLAGVEGAPALEAADVVQPVLWAVMVSLAAVWEGAGVVPDAVVGHSQGEIAAATVAGMLSLEDAARVVALRSRSLKVLAGAGGMLSVAASAETVEGRLGDRVALAAVNGPAAVVVSGEPQALEELKAQFEAEGVRARMVAVDYASHGPQVDRLEAEIREVLSGIAPRRGRVPMVSAMSGETLTGEELDAGYWYDSLRNTVHFDPAVRTLADQGHQVFIEVSPHPVLMGAMNDSLEQVARDSGSTTLPGVVCGTLRRDDDSTARIVTSLAEAWTQGASVDWTKVLPAAESVELPTYAFQHESYWPKGLLRLPSAKSTVDLASAGLGAAGHPLLGAVVELAGAAGVVLTGRLSVQDQPWLADHAVAGLVLLPSTGYVELVVRAGDQVGCGLLEELTLQAPLVVPESGAVQVQVVVGAAESDGRRGVEVFSRPDESAQDNWTRHAAGVLAPATSGAPADEDLTVWPPRNAEPLDSSDLYTQTLANVYGPAFHCLRAAWRRGADIFAEVELPEQVAFQSAAFGLHPALLDAALHAAVLVEEDRDLGGTLEMPFAWTDVELHAVGASALRVRLRPDGRGGLSMTAADVSGAPVVTVGSLVKRPVAVEQLLAAENTLADSLFVQEWTPVEPVTAVTGEWALLGADRFGLVEALAGTGVQVRPFADLAELAELAEAEEVAPGVVLVCPGDEGDGLAGAVHASAGAALELAREWLDEVRLEGARLVAVTCGAVDGVDGEAVTDLAGAAARGLLRSAQAESPERIVLVDLPAVDPAGHAGVLPSVVGCGEPELVIRGGAVYGRRLVRASGELAAVVWPEKAAVSARALLVTGGTGTLGALVARHFVRTGRAGGVVLLSRSGPSAGVAALAAELAELGAWVRVLACDAADRDALTAVVAGIPDDWPLGSVIHSAGVVDDGTIATLTAERLSKVLRAKVDSAWHLHELTAHMNLERFVMFSSAAATLGAPGQGSYVAANSFLDALAGYRQAAGLTGTSLQLGPWAHEEGIGRNLDQRLLARIDQTFVPLDGEEGLVVFDLALTRDETVLMPARLDVAKLRALAANSTEIPPLWRSLAGTTVRRTAAATTAAADGRPGEALRRRLASLSGPERDRVLLDLVRSHASAVLGYGSGEAFDATRAFTDLGFDSLTAVEMRNRLNNETGLRLPATLVFDYPTAAALAGLLRTELTGELPAAAALARPVAVDAADPIAIVGIACRFPGGASSPEGLWQHLSSGTDVIGPLPQDRGWDLDSLCDPETGQLSMEAGGFVRDASGFDAPFFGISPREALAMDPQQRLLLEASWEALEQAGLDPMSLRGSQTGAFVGGSASGYGIGASLEESGVAETHMMTGNATSVLSGRLSYTLGLEGPAVTVDTACSSALVALHLASQAIRSGECSLALVGGVAVATTPMVFVAFSEAGGVSVDGRCKSFSADADGSGFSEGVGMLVIERLSDARRNGHKVLALVRGSAMNQDGASNGLTAPNGPSQQRVIRAALANAAVSAADIDVVEAHGSATTLGDPIEAQALIATYGQERTEDRPLWLGSVKSVIGHTQTAAGAAGLLKMVLALQNEEMPRTLHVEEPTPHVDWSAGEVRLLAEARPWPVGERVRRAGVSAFGMSGTNVHVILEEAPTGDEADAEVLPDAPATAPAVVEPGSVSAWLVSGRSAKALTAQAERLATWAAVRRELEPVDVAWSLATTRSVFEHRAVVFGDGHGELKTGLDCLAGGVASGCVVSGVARSGGRTVFVFAGQGAQWVGMGRELVGSSPVFGARLAECEAALSPHVEWSLADVLAGVEGAPGLGTADVVQPVLWAVMVSLAAVWEAAGVVPDAVVGHSQGEVAAAAVAGMLSLEDAACVVVARSRGLSGLDVEGSMVSVVMPSGAVAELVEGFGGRLSVAAVNGPAAVVVSGELGALSEFERELASRHVLRWRVPETDFVAHSAAVEPLEGVLAAELAGICPVVGRVPMVSTVTGEWVTGEELDAGYWYANLRSMVRFERATRVLLGDGFNAFVEVSAHPVLTGPVAETAEDAGIPGVLAVGTLERDNGGASRLVRSFAQAYVGGLAVDWKTILPSAHTVDLPTYAFQHQRYWLHPATASDTVAAGGDGAGTETEARFWAAVEGGDLTGLADTLAIEDQEQLSTVLPALASWRRREQDRSATAQWRYRVRWTSVAEPGFARLSGPWLVAVPDSPGGEETARQCASLIAARGATPVTVLIPAGVSHRVDIAALLVSALREAGTDVGQVAGVISLLALDETAMDDHPVVAVGLAATLGLVQSLGDARVNAPLWLLTQGAVAAGPADALTNPSQAQVWGFGRVVALEFPDRWGGLIDLPAALDARTGGQLAAVLAGCDENQVAIRPSGIFGRRLTRAQHATDAKRHLVRGAALITGGTGALAGHTARWLAGRGVERLVLTSRSGPAAWGVAEQAARLAALGTGVDVVTCDVSDRSAVTHLVDWTGRSGPALSTVVHTAGVLDDGIIDRLSPDRLETVLAAKAASASYLDEATADLDLDAFVLFSSVVATTGGPGQANYGAANAYLDALAENRRSRGLPALAVAWGPWSGDGVAQSNEAARQRLARNMWEGTMEPELAVQALGEALDGTDPVLTVTNIDWSLALADPKDAAVLLKVPVMRDLPEIQRLAVALADMAAVPAEDELLRRLAGQSRAEQLRTLTELVHAKAAKVLGFASPDAIESDRAFSELGFDSLTAVELRNELGTAVGRRLPATLLFDYPNAAALSEYLYGELLGDLSDDTATPVTGVVAATDDEPIAIVGMACRYPGGVASPDGMWALLSSGTDAISGFPDDRGWDLDTLTSSENYSSYVHAGGFIEDMAGFDADFFGISPREAMAMDPQQRLLLETSWEALERSGVDPEGLRGSATGVFVGGYFSGYGTGAEIEGAAHLITGNATSVLSGRVSYALGLEGPAVTVDTACSSSLVAMHLAAQALRSGECSMALAGGVTIMITADGFVGFSENSGLSQDGRCKAFSAQADGMGFAEGVGMLVVERLSDARRNGHRVLAVVRGSAVNQDGASNGLTAPNGPSQQRVIRAALANAQLSPADVDVVEAHGTGTKLGDPIEAQALLATYGQDRPEGRPVWLGSVKSNIGHTQAAAGVAGVIKMVLALQHEQLPRALHADEPSPHVDWTAGDVKLLTEPVPWPAGERVRRAAVSSFGLSGTNAHVILEQAPVSFDAAASDEEPDGIESIERAAEAVAPVVSGASAWLVSGRSTAGLAGQAGRLREWVTDRPELEPADVAWSLAATRSVFEHRAVVVGADRAELVAGLESLRGEVLTGSVVSGVARSGVRPVFVFPGQGSQWLGMGRGLVEVSPVFAARLAECAAALAPHVEWSLMDVLVGVEGAPALEAADVVQPVLWAVMVSLAAVWEGAGVVPDAVVGHSQGEIAAATVAGMLSLEDAACVVALRSRSLKVLAGAGGMLSVAASAETVEGWLGDRVALAAVNGPAAVVVSGEPQALEELKAQFEAEGVRARMVAVDYASHGPQVDRLEAEIREVLAGLSPRRGRVPMVSAMSGETLTGEELDAGYWYDSLRNTVHFDRAVRTLADQGHQVFIEVSPHPVLTSAMTDTLEETAGPTTLPAAVCGTLRRDDDSAARVLTSLAEAWVQGASVDWAKVLPAAESVELPTYAFQHERYWPKAAVTSGGDASSLGLGAVEHPLLGATVELADGAGVVCTGRLSVRSQPWLADHRVGGVILLPGTGFVELAVQAGDQVGCGVLEELTLHAPLVVPESGGIQVQVVVAAADGDGRRGVEVFSRAAGSQEPWVQHAEGVLAPAGRAVDAGEEFTVWPPSGADAVDVSGMYDALDSNGYGYGPAFQGLKAVWRRDGDVFAEVALAQDEAAQATAFALHPALLDAVLHAASLAGVEEGGPDQVRLPFAWTGVELHATGASVLRARIRRDEQGSLTLAAADATGAPVVSVASLITRAVTAEQLKAAEAGPMDALFTIEWAPLAESAVPAGEWALIGADRFGLVEALAGTGVQVRPFTDLTELVEAAEFAPGVVLACAGAGQPNGADAARAAQEATGEALALAQQWLAEERLEPARLLVVTRGGVAASAGERVTDLAASAVWGLLRSAQSENPGRIVLADLPADGADDRSAAALPTALADGEAELAVRGTTAYGRRLTRPSGDLAMPDGAWRLVPDEGGSLDGLRFESGPEPVGAVPAGHVRVAVKAAGLNFRDVLISLGMYPGGGVLGSEVSGVVVETGPGVTALAVGDRVMGVADGGFGPLAVTDARHLVRIPEQWTYAEAASVPSAFMTAWYALVELAGVRVGQRVLIHAGAGGVGMAAVRIARHLGAEVFATASPAKWPVLERMGLDAEHVASSRDAGFEEAFAAVTGGAGVDVVVNSLAGELIDASLRLLPRGGAFVEMGATDLRDADTVAAEHPGVTYRPFNLAEAGTEGLGAMLSEISALMAKGALSLLPVRAWDVRRAREAFRFMSQAKHTGKIVLTIPATPVAARLSAPVAARTALVTGGTGTLGSLAARHLAATGRTDSVVLTSRSGAGAPGVAELAAQLAESGTSVRVVACDTAERDGLAKVLAGIPAEAPLRTVIHTAGVLDDGTIGSLTADRVASVMRPKADGAWNLHELTRHLDLDHFALFSSAAAAFSSPGQGNYVAANAFLDALAADRRAAGLPATSLCWGLWAEASALTGRLTDSERARINRGGISALSAEEGLALLDASLARDEAVLVPARLDLAGLRAQSARNTEVPSLWRALVGAGTGRRAAASGSTPAGPEALHRELAGLSEQEREARLVDMVRAHAAAVLGHASTGAVETTRAFTDLGFDSLTAVELRNRLSGATGLRLPATLVFDYPNPAELAVFLGQKLAPKLGDSARTDAPDPAESTLRNALATVPLARFREAGLMEALMQLAGVREEALASDTVEDIDALDAESLIRMALDGESE